MIHIFVGTKAQLIKMAPIIQILDADNIPYNFIDAGQHAGLTTDLREQFNLRHPDIKLRNSEKNITTVFQALIWVIQSIWQILFRKKYVFEQLFQGQHGICLIHGDTLTTLLSLFYAKRCGIQVAHVEAGLRSYNIWNPFPEELIRLIVMRFSDVLFAPSEWALTNLRKMGYADKAVNIGGNTGIDAVRYALSLKSDTPRPKSPYAIVTTHRVETIYSQERLQIVVSLLERLAKEYTILFVLHEPTRNQLVKFNMFDRLVNHEGIEITPLRPYLTFIELIAGADFIITDGGSIQEESFFLGVPCLVMRSKTERMEGIGENAFLAEFSEAEINRFFAALPTLRKNQLQSEIAPSRMIVDWLVNERATYSEYNA